MKKILLIAVVLTACKYKVDVNAKIREATVLNDSAISVYWQWKQIDMKDSIKVKALNEYDNKLDDELGKLYDKLPDSAKDKIVSDYWRETSIKERLEKSAEQLK